MKGLSRSVLLAAVIVAGASSGCLRETSLHVRVQDAWQVALVESVYTPGVILPGHVPSRQALRVTEVERSWPYPERDVEVERRASGGITLGYWDRLVADDGSLRPLVLGDYGGASVTEGRLRLRYDYRLGSHRHLGVYLTTPVSNVSQLWRRRGTDRLAAAVLLGFGVAVSGMGALSWALFNPPGTPTSFPSVFFPSVVIAAGFAIDVVALVGLFAPDVDTPLSPRALETIRVE